MPAEYRGFRRASSAIPASTAVGLDALLQRELRLNVGRGRRFSCEELGDALEVSPRRIKAIRDGEQRAGLDLGLRIAALLGPGSLNRLLHVVGYIARPMDEPDAEEAAHALLADLGE